MLETDMDSWKEKEGLLVQCHQNVHQNGFAHQMVSPAPRRDHGWLLKFSAGCQNVFWRLEAERNTKASAMTLTVYFSHDMCNST